ncbi:nitrogen fixation protein NifU [Thermosipho melanesiensis]|uniref:SUF system FeS assembly protein, NifU family n=2 Tax=Thermosipho melanesiensis TaxID=46541 RepID=A6LJ25_THEM4|nr:SUF system NifU family Fe-S cluster assembly protein [Thermosipho melanesiensis]ABR29926.1 SUF system FeS assembly protein, NifU family [Thermosipho melanesiensis BI429]OOC38531.1 nitrogen fixation protein NifU [Thermosipho melanesiensis]OOC40335.1 nitrogen fixation protein NifU [Thermosipho melanesiensis]OOC40599.1 nitrogen fixation protein NifU [Thermosipho melanesiensis]OOC44446.1 nitrogen fixation protein NifU [Thermosipho melanesiensis]
MYSEIIMDYSKLTKYKGKLDNPTVVEEGKNLSCGDEIKLYLKIEDDKIIDVKFEGIGCAISQASTNLMIESILGKSKREVKEILKNIYSMARGEEYDKEKIGIIKELENIKKYPMRIKCFLLSWKTLDLALKEKL